MILSPLIACALYVMVTIVMVSAVDPSGYLDTETGKAREDPVYVFAEMVGSTAGTVSAVFAVTVLTSLALASRWQPQGFHSPWQGTNLLPESLEKVHPSYQTPHLAIIGTSVSMALAITLLASRGDSETRIRVQNHDIHDHQCLSDSPKGPLEHTLGTALSGSP